MKIRKLRRRKAWIVTLPGKWWIGPYDTHQDAKDAKVGQERFLEL